MTVSNISAPGTSELVAQASTTTAKPDELGKDAFMKLLMAQIKHQDPMAPEDPKQFVTQLSELTGVEQLTSIKERMGALELATIGSLNQQTASVVGRNIEADTSSMRLGYIGPVTSRFEVEGNADQVTAVVRDSSGRAVRTLVLGPQGQGDHSMTWDGKDDNGQRVPPGTYSLDLEAKNAAGGPVQTNTRVKGRVTSVSYENGVPELNVDGAVVRMADVVSIGI